MPESADWYNSSFIIAWGSNVPQTRTPDAHFFTEVRYKGTKTVAVTPDYSEVAKLADIWMHPKQGTDAARGDGDGPRDPEGVLLPGRGQGAQRLLRRLRAPLHRPADAGDAEGAHAARAAKSIMVPDRYVRASDFNGKLGQANNPEWKTVAFDETGKVVLPQRRHRLSLGPRRPRRPGPVEPRSEGGAPRQRREAQAVAARRRAAQRRDRQGRLSRISAASPASIFRTTQQNATCWCARCPCNASRSARKARSARRWWPRCSTCRSANYGVARGLPGELAANDFDDDTPYTPAWQERITGTPRAQVITVARQFAENADKTHGKSMVIIGAAMNHWYHSDMNYRGVINMLMMCGCIGKSGGGWAHYVGPGKAAPADRLDGARVRARLDPPAAAA